MPRSRGFEMGRTLDVHGAVYLFMAATLPPYFALLGFGYYQDKLEFPIICGGLAAVLLRWLIDVLDAKTERKTKIGKVE